MALFFVSYSKISIFLVNLGINYFLIQKMTNSIKPYYLIPLLLLVISCAKTREKVPKKEIKSNIIETYLKNAENRDNNNEDRRENLKKAYTIYVTLEDDVYKREKIAQMSAIYYEFKEYDMCKKLNNKMLRLATKIKDSFGMAKANMNLGIHYQFTKLDTAFSYFSKSNKLYEKLNRYPYEHGKTLISMARILQATKDNIGSEALTIDAIQKFELAKKERYLPTAYTNLGIISNYFEHYDQAISYHLRAIEYAKNSKRKIYRTIASYNNIGNSYRLKKDYKSAKKYYDKALSYKEYLKGNPKTYARLIDNKAYADFLSGEERGLPDLFFKALYIRDSIDHKRGLISNSLHLSEYYQSKGEDSLAIQYATRAKDISLEIDNNEELLKSYQILSEVAPSDEGVQYAHAYIKLSDSLQREERLFRDKFARIEYETDQIKEENQQIAKENDRLIVAVLGLSALFILGYIIFRQKQSNKELLFAQRQQESNQEIYRLLLNQQIKLEEGRQLEQQRMSEELHDGVLGRLFGVRLSLDGINQRANDGFTDARNKYIEELKSIEKEIRLISHDLGTDSISPDVAYADVVESLISDLCEAHSMEFEFENDENIDWDVVNNHKKVNIYRILQESLQNIFKHAQAQKIKISFDYSEDKINLTILDDGIGFNSNKVKKGIGLKNITSRVRQMSGMVDFMSNKGGGTSVLISIPSY
ncbi:sensor histidine kinase [Aquimarina sp. TRL1]|uniref:tetratricopeptide repeat-containing sensor histidine kinase n=1 Tax=Aquimarina sp. (strain TRL1) TaxID=2736252 RepID=UPI0015886F03|nr:sensor histidine kinase [Aquimarina sp. TRL1]QKX06294.1 sensor histidine kinase [Aquimarina sp. TRL1]